MLSLQSSFALDNWLYNKRLLKTASSWVQSLSQQTTTCIRHNVLWWPCSCFIVSSFIHEINILNYWDKPSSLSAAAAAARWGLHQVANDDAGNDRHCNNRRHCSDHLTHWWRHRSPVALVRTADTYFHIFIYFKDTLEFRIFNASTHYHLLTYKHKLSTSPRGKVKVALI